VKEARLAYSRDVISHAELLIKKYTLRFDTTVDAATLDSCGRVPIQSS